MNPIRTIAFFVVALASAHAWATEPVVVGYVPDYRISTITPTQASRCSGLVLFSIQPSDDGSFPAEPLSAEALSSFGQLCDGNDTRRSICVGGWGRSDHFPVMTSSTTQRQAFIEGLRAYCHQHGFTGVDYDWEHPQGPEQLDHYAKLVRETKLAFAPDGFDVTVAQAPWQNLGQAMYNAVDRIHLMAYDHDFPQATIAKAGQDVDRLIAWGCPPSKIVLGVPFYGRNANREAKTYHELTQDLDVVPGTDQIDGYALNSPATIKAKLKMIQSKRLAGIMIWEIGQDAPDMDASLLNLIQKTIAEQR